MNRQTFTVTFFEPDASGTATVAGVVTVAGSDRFGTFTSERCLLRILKRLRQAAAEEAAGRVPAAPDRVLACGDGTGVQPLPPPPRTAPVTSPWV